jgi:hypothetical protein
MGGEFGISSPASDLGENTRIPANAGIQSA